VIARDLYLPSLFFSVSFPPAICLALFQTAVTALEFTLPAFGALYTILVSVTPNALASSSSPSAPLAKPSLFHNIAVFWTKILFFFKGLSSLPYIRLGAPVLLTLFEFAAVTLGPLPPFDDVRLLLATPSFLLLVQINYETL